MGEIELKYNNESELISYPEKWNELTIQQLLYISNLWESWQLMARNNVSLLRAKALLVLELFNGNTRFNRKQRAEIIAALPEEDLTDLVHLTNFIFNSNTLTTCPLPIVKVGFTKYYTLNDGVTNISAFEFNFADRFFVEYSESGSEDALNNFIASLYCPGTSLFNNNRKHFNVDLIERHAKHLSKLKYSAKQLILLWYIGCRTLIVKNNQDLFSSENTDSAKNEGWIKLIMAMSGDKFGTFTETGKTDFLLILMELREMKERKPKAA